MATNYRLRTLSALARQNSFLASPRPPLGADMKSWKKERYRRQKLFIETKKHRRFAKDIELFSNEMIKSWASSVRMFLWKEKEPK